MPSGAKKRKAAKRKKEEMGIHHPPPHSSTNTQGNNGLESDNSDHHLTEEEVEMESSDSGRGEAKEGMVAGERGAVVDETNNTSDVDVYEDKEVGIEYVEAKMEDNGSGAHLEEEPSPAEASSEVVLQQSVAPLTEEEVEPPTSTVGSVQIHDIEVTTEVAPAPLLEHRASLWNCCGLLDVFKGNQR